MADTLVDDDEAWLYGSEGTAGDDKEGNDEQEASKSSIKAEEDEESLGGVQVTNDAQSVDGEIDEHKLSSNLESGEVSGGEEETKTTTKLLAENDKDGGSELDDEEESDDDDDVQVTIGDIKSAPAYGYGGAPMNLNIKRGCAFSAIPSGGVAGKAKGIDLETVGNINGVPIYEFNLDSLEEKPWRKPGADITDYFNYGFNEETWKLYCDRQRKLRTENNVVAKQAPHTPMKVGDQLIQIATVNENSKYSGVVAAVKKAGPPPGRKMSGCIDVIGGGVPSLPSRRPATNAKENAIQVIGRKQHMEPPPGLPPPPHLAPTHMPPPPFPPPSFEPNISIPPPPVSLPGMPPPMPPISGMITNTTTAYPEGYEGFMSRFPPPPATSVSSDRTSSQYDEQNFGNGSNSHPQYDRSSSSSSHWNSSSSRDRDRDRDRERDRDRDREHRDHDSREQRERRSYSHWEHSSTDEERRRYREYRERSRDKSRGEREYRERDGDREKDYDKERKHRERKEREERHREHSSRRRHHHEEGSEHEHRISRHRHKRTKREKDEEGVGTEVSETSNFSPEVEEKPAEQ